MNHQEAGKLLSDFVDQTLPARQMAKMDDHLRECDECRREVAQLRALLEQATDLPQGMAPSRNLWPDIASRLATHARPRPAGILEQALRTWRGMWVMGTAAAAVVIIAVVSHQASVQESRPPENPQAIAIIASLEAECRQAEWEIDAYAQQSSLDNSQSLLDIFSQDLQIIDQAISEARAAWAANPNSPRLVRMLAAAYRAKITLQGRMTVTVAQT